MPHNDSLNIRIAEPDDAPALAALVTALGFPASADQIADRLSAMLADEELILVADREGERLGMLTVHVTPVLHRPTAVGRLTALIVAEHMRGRGIGRALVKRAEQLLESRGCGLIEVTSHVRLTDAHSFYERLGYEVTSLRFGKALKPAS